MKSGIATGWPPMDIDSSARVEIHIQETILYTSIEVSFLSFTLFVKSQNTSQSIPPWPSFTPKAVSISISSISFLVSLGVLILP